MAAGQSKCFEVAKAVNEIMRLDSKDQGALPDVISDYFTAPDYCTDSDIRSDGQADTESDTKHTRLGIE